MPCRLGLEIVCASLSLNDTHGDTRDAYINIFQPLVWMLKFDWWGNRWQIAVSILMDDIIWPNLLITYAKPESYPPPPVFLRSSLLTIDQSEFCTPASFEFNAWGRRAVDVALYCPSQSLITLPSLHFLIYLYLAVTDPVVVCLFTLVCRQSFRVKWPACFEMDCCLHVFNYRRCLNGDLLRERLRKMGSVRQPLISSVNVCSNHQTGANIVQLFISSQCVCQRIL